MQPKGWVVETCHGGTDVMLRVAVEGDLDDEVWDFRDEALEAARDLARDMGCRIYGDEAIEAARDLART